MKTMKLLNLFGINVKVVGKLNWFSPMGSNNLQLLRRTQEGAEGWRPLEVHTSSIDTCIDTSIDTCIGHRY